ncbi:MAG: protein sorting system archaetidylserine decarboxylase [Halobacteria archaeon]|nr:protein sorting system archaetidylserine decarboxylase [Halobacteria archaeon]
MRLARGAVQWILLSLVPPAVAFVFWFEAGVVLLLLPLLVVVFFRDPERSPEGDGVVSPADGRVSVLRQENGKLRLGIFMNIYNVHVNRAPVSGKVTELEHEGGSHWPAFTKSSDANESLTTRIRTQDSDFKVVQIAGTLARRITPYIEDGQGIKRGERMGIIAFSSRVDVVFPESYSSEDIKVEKGDSVRAGETVIAHEQ